MIRNAQQENLSAYIDGETGRDREWFEVTFRGSPRRGESVVARTNLLEVAANLSKVFGFELIDGLTMVRHPAHATAPYYDEVLCVPGCGRPRDEHPPGPPCPPPPPPGTPHG